MKQLTGPDRAETLAERRGVRSRTIIAGLCVLPMVGFPLIYSGHALIFFVWTAGIIMGWITRDAMTHD